MDILNSSLLEDVKDVLEKPAPKQDNQWKLTFHLPSGDMEAMKVDYVQIERDYEKRYGDLIYVQVTMRRRDVIQKIYPMRETLMATLYRKGSNGPINQLLKVTIRDNLPSLGTGVASDMDEHDDPKTDRLFTLTVQLLSRFVEHIRLASFGHTGRQTTVERFLTANLSLPIPSVKLPSEELIDGIDMIPADNTQVYRSLTVPSYVPIYKVPKYCQEILCGVYKDGINHYIQDRHWYVYPEHRVTHFNSTEKKLTVVSVPENRLPKPENSWFTDGKSTVILSTGSKVEIEMKEILQLQFGNAVRMNLARRMIHVGRTVNGDDVTVNRKESVIETSNHLRQDGRQVAPFADHPITDNVYRELSKIEGRDRQLIEVEWQNSSLDVIYPGMPVRYIYMKGNEVKEIYGQVLQFNFKERVAGEGINNPNYESTGSLKLMLESTDA